MYPRGPTARSKVAKDNRATTHARTHPASSPGKRHFRNWRWLEQSVAANWSIVSPRWRVDGQTFSNQKSTARRLFFAATVMRRRSVDQNSGSLQQPVSMNTKHIHRELLVNMIFSPRIPYCCGPSGAQTEHFIASPEHLKNAKKVRISRGKC